MSAVSRPSPAQVDSCRRALRRHRHRGPASHVSPAVSVAIVGGGVTGGHPLVGRIDRSVRVVPGWAGQFGSRVERCLPVDRSGVGTECAAAVRTTAPAAALWSVEVLGDGTRGPANALAEALRWTVAQHADVVLLTAWTDATGWAPVLRGLVDTAHDVGTIVVAAPGPTCSLLAMFDSVISPAPGSRPTDAARAAGAAARLLGARAGMTPATVHALVADVVRSGVPGGRG